MILLSFFFVCLFCQLDFVNPFCWSLIIGTYRVKYTQYLKIWRYRHQSMSGRVCPILLSQLGAVVCKVDWIRSHHLHLQWKFKLWAGKFAWGVKANITGFCQQTFENKYVVCWHHPARFCLITSSKLFHPYFNFHWSWIWWDVIQAIFLNLFYFNLRIAL